MEVGLYRVESGVEKEEQEAEQPKRLNTKQVAEGLSVTEKELACFQHEDPNAKMCIKV
jgi:hypothetical protein